MKLTFDLPIETLEPVAIVIIRPLYPDFQYFAYDILSALSFIRDNEHRLCTSEIFIRSVPFTKLFEINPDHYINNPLFRPWWKLN